MPARFQNLISAQILAMHCDDPDWVVLDCRFDLSDPDAGAYAYAQGHIPGAIFADLEKDLSSPPSLLSGRHPLPEPGQLARRFGAWGLARESQLVVYDEQDSAFAARAWWLARWLGHGHVAVLDGGLKAWQREGLPIVTAQATKTPTVYEPQVQRDLVVETESLLSELDAGAIVLDARVAERFMGDTEPLDPRAGHVPGAHNYPYLANLDRHGKFLPAAELRTCLDAARCGRPTGRIIAMCGSGVTACHNLLAMEIAGLDGGRLYAGSWSEWCRDPDRAVAAGPDTDG